MVVGCTGHQGLSVEIRRTVAASISAELARVPTRVTGVCSLAEGADQVFAHSILAGGGELRAVLPSEGYAAAFSRGGLNHFRSLLAVATETTTLPYASPSEAAFLAAGQRVVDISEMLIAIWDGGPAKGLGGTADIVSYAEGQGRTVVKIWPSGAKRV